MAEMMEKMPAVPPFGEGLTSFPPLSQKRPKIVCVKISTDMSGFFKFGFFVM